MLYSFLRQKIILGVCANDNYNEEHECRVQLDAAPGGNGDLITYKGICVIVLFCTVVSFVVLLSRFSCYIELMKGPIRWCIVPTLQHCNITTLQCCNAAIMIYWLYKYC